MNNAFEANPIVINYNSPLYLLGLSRFIWIHMKAKCIFCFPVRESCSQPRETQIGCRSVPIHSLLNEFSVLRSSGGAQGVVLRRKQLQPFSGFLLHVRHCLPNASQY